jgi:transposase InsO family protein
MNKRALMKLVKSGITMDRIATDILGELPMTENGNRYILGISDYFTKWTESFPMPNMEAATVVRIIVEEVVARFGVPASIHSDQGRQYESELFSEMCRVLHIKTRTTPYHPQSDGMVERFNKTLVTMLSAYVNEHHSNWDSYLPYVMMAYRASVHETSGFTPNYMMLGREVSTPLDLMYEMPQATKFIPYNKWAWKLKETLEDAHRFVRENIDTAMMRKKNRYHDQKLSWQQFKPDDVYVYFPLRKVGRSPKFTSYW